LLLRALTANHWSVPWHESQASAASSSLADPRRWQSVRPSTCGLALNDYGGATFQWSDEVPAGTGMTTWSAFPANTTYFGDGPQAAMINYASTTSTPCSPACCRRSLDRSKREDASYGRFAWIKDCDGNRLELWQPLAD